MKREIPISFANKVTWHSKCGLKNDEILAMRPTHFFVVVEYLSLYADENDFIFNKFQVALRL